MTLAIGQRAGMNCGKVIVMMAVFISRRPMVVGRADARTGQLSIEEAVIVVPADIGSWVGQCVSSDAGARHVASHHARAGAAAPIRTASRTIARWCTTISV